MWRDAGSGELHAKFFDSPPNGSHALPPTVQVVAQPVAPRIEQSVARQRHGTADTADAHNLTTPPMTAEGAAHRLPVKQASTRGAVSRPPRDHAQARDETTVSNVCFPRQQAEKSAHNQHVVSFNPDTEPDQPTGRHKHTNGPRRHTSGGTGRTRPTALWSVGSDCLSQRFCEFARFLRAHLDNESAAPFGGDPHDNIAAFRGHVEGAIPRARFHCCHSEDSF